MPGHSVGHFYFCGMDDEERRLKMFLYAHCEAYVKGRIAASETAIRLAQEGAESDTKSSAGDKYETGREMMQQEITRHQQQLLEAGKMRHSLSQIMAETASDVIVPGAVTETSQGNFYLSVSAGQAFFTGKNYQPVSIISPIGRMLSGRKAGEEFDFNGKTYRILRVF